MPTLERLCEEFGEIVILPTDEAFEKKTK